MRIERKESKHILKRRARKDHLIKVKRVQTYMKYNTYII